MVPDDGTVSGSIWNDTDEQNVIPVRTSAAAPATAPSNVRNAPTDIDGIAGNHPEQNRDIHVQENGYQPVDSRRMGVAAILGVTIVLLSVGLYAGIGSIRGDISGGMLTVSITQAGLFDPPSIDVKAGQVITITNANQNPQVLKSSDPDRLLFPVQVLFPATPFIFTIPVSAGGSYIYVSETLPADRTLTINVSPATPIPFGEGAISSQQSSMTGEIPIPFGQTSSVRLEIPIPFGRSTSSYSSSVPSSSSSSVHSSSSSSSSSSVTVSVGGGRQTWGGNVCAGGTCYVSGGYAPPNYIAPAPLPINPYTVGSNLTPQTITTPQGTVKTVTTDGSHTGAQVQELSKHRPKAVSDTGPANILLLIIPALLGVILMFERKLRVGM